MTIEAGLAVLAVVAFFIFRWGFRHLPGEGWQIAWVIPARDAGTDGIGWPAVNITFYGVISALAYATAALAYFFLMGAFAQPLAGAALYAGLLLAVGIPASKLVNRWVEGVPGHTIGGATFSVIVAAVPALMLAQWLTSVAGLGRLDPAIALAAAGATYVLGESIGRLACLSFGCCYGKPIASCTPLQQALYGSTATVYRGRMKKIAYASNLAGTPVVAVQSIACVLLFVLFLLTVWLLWRGHAGWATVIAISGSQLWRAYSESLRADYRGRDGFTVYQGMALIGAALAPLYAAWAGPAGVALPTARAGWNTVFSPEVFLACQALGLLILVYMGRSYVTSARLDFSLHVSPPR